MGIRTGAKMMTIQHSMNSVLGSPDQRWGCISWAQHFDDGMILNLFEMLNSPKPSYLDLGAHHPITISNTKLLYDRGSSGINVEANPNLIDAFKKERPRDTNLNVGVGPVAGEATFFMYSDTSGLNTFSTEEMAVNSMAVKKQLLLPIVTVNSIVEDHCGGIWPHLLTCDIEGLDFDVLSGADFNSSAPMVICVETRRSETARMSAMLERKGYFLYCRMGENLFFVRKALRERVY